MNMKIFNRLIPHLLFQTIFILTKSTPIKRTLRFDSCYFIGSVFTSILLTQLALDTFTTKVVAYLFSNEIISYPTFGFPQKH